MTARWGHACASLGGRIYAVGGCSLPRGAQPRQVFMETLQSCEVYDPDRDEWRPCASLRVARSGLKVVALKDRYLVAVGGCDDVFGRAETQPTVELYDTHLDSWTVLDTRLAHPRTSAGVVAVDNHRLVIVGGARSLSSTEVYRVSLPSHESTSGDEAKYKEEKAASNSNESVGGERCNEQGGGPRVRQFKCIPAYDIATGTWREDEVVPPMSSPRTAVALCVGVGRPSVSS